MQRGADSGHPRWEFAPAPELLERLLAREAGGEYDPERLDELPRASMGGAVVGLSGGTRVSRLLRLGRDGQSERCRCRAASGGHRTREVHGG
jgi:hypothetical protein